MIYQALHRFVRKGLAVQVYLYRQTLSYKSV